MARGISIKDVENKVQNINDNNVLPISTGADVPEVVTVGVLKEHINEDVETAIEGKQDIINDLSAIRSGAALGATALQDSDISGWAKASTKPTYTVSEIDGAQEELVSGTNIKTINGTSVLGGGNITIQGGGGGDVNVIESITFNGSAVPVDGNKNAAITYTETEPDFNGSAAATITSADITAWNGKSTFSGSYDDLTDKPTLFSGAYADLTGKPNLATVATSGDYDDLSNKPNIPSAVTESTVSGWGFTKNTGTVTSVTVNGSTYSPTNGDVDLGTIGGGGGTSVQADWAQTDSTADDYIKNKPSINSSYYAAWIATSSAAGNVKLTNTLTLPEGVYILMGQYPILNNPMISSLDLTNITTLSGSTNQCYYNGQNYLSIIEILFVGQGGGSAYLKTAASTSVTYTHTERGFIAAIKIA